MPPKTNVVLTTCKLFLFTFFLLTLFSNSQSQAQDAPFNCLSADSLFGESENDQFGRILVGGSDFNNDGTPDFIVASQYVDPDNSNDQGKVYLYSGLDLSLLKTFEPTISGWHNFGRSVDTLGDINNDGYGDLIVGASAWYDSSTATTIQGAAVVFSGLDKSVLFVATYDSSSNWFGKSVACIGDLNNDNINEFAVAGATYDSFPYTDSSRVVIYDGATFAKLHTLKENIYTSQDGYGFKVIGPGDLNNDSIPDIVVSDVLRDWVYVYSGADYSLLWSLGNMGADFGADMAGLGNVNNDSYNDIIISTSSGISSTYILSGFDGSVIYNMVLATSYSVGRVGDINRDGYADFAIGQYDNSRGRFDIFSGKDTTRLYFSGGKYNGNHYGNKIIAADLDSDGISEIIVAAANFSHIDNGTASGLIKIYGCISPDSTCFGGNDIDNDGWNDECDNCKFFYDQYQRDTDDDGIGDACNDDASVWTGSDVLMYGISRQWVTFDSVSVGGDITVQYVTDGPALDPNFAILPNSGQMLYNVSTTATFEGNVEVCFYYDPTDVINEDSVKIYHYDSTGAWVDITTNLQTQYNLVCGVTDHFSPFAVVVNKVAMDIEHIDTPNLPDNFSLSQNYPNPFNPTTEIQFSLPSRTNVSIEIFNTIGQRVKTLHNGELSAGSYNVTWDGSNESGSQVASGVYMYRLTTDNYTASKKMILMK